MLSDDTRQHIDELLARQDAYRPSGGCRAILAGKTLIMLVGPTGAGKSTVMRELTRLAPDISIVGTITTRPPRPDDQLDRYTFYEHTDEGLKPLFDDIAAGRLVQYVVNPYSHQLYGSAPEDYPATVNVGDYFSSVVDEFHSYGFGHILAVTIVTSPDCWLARFNERFPEGHPQRDARRAEAIESLHWSLGPHKTAHYFVVNHEGAPEAAAIDIRRILEGRPPNQSSACQMAEQCLAAITALR